MELRDQFWEVLNRGCPGADFQHVPFLVPADATREFRLFEILVIDALNRLEPDLEWTVTGVHEGDGIEFRGEGAPRVAQLSGLTVQRILLGRTKRQARPTVSLVRDIEVIVAAEPSRAVSGVILVLAGGPVPRDELRSLAKMADATAPEASKFLVGAERFEEFWSAKRVHLVDVLTPCLTEEEIHVVRDYLHSVAEIPHTEVISELARDRLGQAGKRLECTLRLEQRDPMPKVRVALEFVPAGNDSTIEVLLPSRLAQGVYPVDLAGGKVTELEIWLRSMKPGRHELGTIRIRSETGAVIASVPLGECEFQPSFEPPYFEKPNWSAHQEFSSRLREVTNGDVQAVTILGAGGSGKSKFCEAVIEEAADLGLGWVQIGHRNTTGAPRRLVCNLFDRLLGPHDGLSLADRLIERLRRILSPFSEQTRQALRTYLEAPTESVAVTPLAGALFALISEGCDERPFLLHLHDLHWADGETLSILGETIDLLEGSRQPHHPGALFLLEGRDRESLRLQSGFSRPPEDWLTFLDGQGHRALTLKAWNANDSKEFLGRVLDFQEAATQRPIASGLPLSSRLWSHILESSSGNPMHMIEQLKWLVEREYAQVSDKGTIFLRDEIPSDWKPPDRTEEVIASRLDFLRSLAPAAAELLTVMAKIGRTVPGELFRAVTTMAPGEGVLSALHRIDMAHLPRHGAETFEFHHENYFQVCRGYDLPPDSRYLTAALKFYEAWADLSAKDRFDVAFLMVHREQPDYPAIVDHARQGLERATAENDDLLGLDLCRLLLGIPKHHLVSCGVEPAELRVQKGVRQKLTGSWEDSLKTLRQAEVELREGQPSLRRFVDQLRCKVDIVNGLVTLMETDQALDEVDAALRLIELRGDLDSSDGGDVSAEIVELRDWLWHRRAVAQWFDGDIVAAAKWQRRAYSSGRRHDNPVTVGKTLREFGTLLLHRNPVFGRRLIMRSLRELSTVPDAHHEPALLSEAELLVADLLIAQWIDGSLDPMGEFLERATRLHLRCQEKASLYEAPLAALAAGSCAALLDQLDQARHWFKLATTTSMRARAFDQVWKGRLSLGQICLALGEAEEARLHAQEAAYVIEMGLKAGRWERRSARRSLFAMPLYHCIRLDSGLAGRYTQFLRDADPAPNPWSERPGPIARSGESPQMLHVRRGIDDYYLIE